MKILGFLLIVSLVSCGPETSERNRLGETLNSAIIQGEKCQPFQYPASMEIFAEALVNMPLLGERWVVGPICSGVLIEPDVVLTAAHCLDEQEITQGLGKISHLRFAIASDLNIHEFKERKMIPPRAIWASSWKKHERANNGTTQLGLQERNDIGLLFLSQFSSIKPVSILPKEKRDYLAEGVEVNIVGWGQQAIDADLQNPQSANFKMCAKTKVNRLGEFEMQIGSDERSPRKCFGDSGGATYLESPDKELYLVGITSHSYDLEGCLQGGVDTRVDAHLDWISDTIKHERL